VSFYKGTDFFGPFSLEGNRRSMDLEILHWCRLLVALEVHPQLSVSNAPQLQNRER
jgi:hypothetical protein